MKCNICGTEFHAIREKHYVSRNTTKTGLAVFVSSDEPERFDTFDCPNCGCQVIAQERKREYAPSDNFTDQEMLDEIGYSAIAEYLGLSAKQMNRIREAKECGVEIFIGKPGEPESTISPRCTPAAHSQMQEVATQALDQAELT